MYMQYFHPDNMSSAEKLKVELKKVRDEFKMSESDCGSARVQGKISLGSVPVKIHCFCCCLFVFVKKNLLFPFLLNDPCALSTYQCTDNPINQVLFSSFT